MRVHEKAVKALAAQERILKNARLSTTRNLSRLPAGTILHSDLDATEKREHEEFIHLIAVNPPKTLNINLEDVPISVSMKLVRWDAYIEKPAQNLVRKILELEGQITRVNAFNNGWKGIFWTLDGEEYFTPLSLKDYEGSCPG